MTAQTLLRQMLTERRAFARGTADWQWRTNAARKYVRMIRYVPVSEWNP